MGAPIYLIVLSLHFGEILCFLCIWLSKKVSPEINLSNISHKVNIFCDYLSEAWLILFYLFIIYLNFLVHNLNYPYIPIRVTLFCSVFILLGLWSRVLGYPLAIILSFDHLGLVYLHWTLNPFVGLCRRLIFELIVVAVVAYLGFFEFEWLGWFCHIKVRALQGWVYWVSSPLLLWLPIPHFLIHGFAFVCEKTWNQSNGCFMIIIFFFFFSFVYLLFIIGSMGMMRCYYQSFTFY